METRTKILVIHDWMLSLGLTDKQQKLLALIYGYSQDGCSRMRATASSLSDWLGCSPRNAQLLTRQLEGMGLIAHEVVFDRRRKCNVTEFWVLMEYEKTEKTKINWSGKGRPVYEADFVKDYETHFVNGNETNFVNHSRVSRYSSNSNNKNRGGNNSARSRAKTTTTTTTGFLFENNIGLTPEDLPYQESYFVEAWEALLKQPKWQDKTVEALKITLDDLAAVYDPVIAAYCCRLAITKGWDNISNPQKIYEDDEEKVMAFSRLVNSREEEAKDEK